MSAERLMEELSVSGLGGSGLGEVDEPAFSGLVERHRRELHVHCYRMLRDDIRCSMPPTPGLYVGREAVVNDWVQSGFADMKHLRAVHTFVNRQPAVAFYHWRQPEGAYLPLTIDVLRITGGAIAEIITFHNDQFPRLGLPQRLPAHGTE